MMIGRFFNGRFYGMKVDFILVKWVVFYVALNGQIRGIINW
jgi:hypothetical protein